MTEGGVGVVEVHPTPFQKGLTMLVSPENQLTPFGIFLASMGLLLSSGALAWFFRSGTTVRIAHETAKQALQKADETSPKVATLQSELQQTRNIADQAHALASSLEPRVTAVQTQLAQHEAVIQEIRTQMRKLDQVDVMLGAVQSMREILSGAIPREEANRQWDNDNRRIERVEADVRTLFGSPKTNP